MGVTTAVPLGSLYNMSKFALEGLTEGLYYELKPFNISLHLIEQGGSEGNNFGNNIIWPEKDGINVYDNLTNKLKQLMDARDPEMLDDPQVIVNEIAAFATGENKEFRKLIGNAGNGLMQMRKSMPIENYLETIAANFS
jgi:NAD(P)-dependent dehydrogenase (short-subunit alcohol dehydrogenase family)